MPANQLDAISTSTTPDVHTRALTALRPIRPTSRSCRSARQHNPGRGSTYRRGNSVQRFGASAGGSKFGGASVTSNRDSSLTTRRSIHPAIHERVVAQKELKRQNSATASATAFLSAVLRPVVSWLHPPLHVTLRLTQGIATPPTPCLR